MEAKLKHLEMIQGIINRMASNSFHLKGWVVILVTALFALEGKGSDLFCVHLAYFPTLAFWVLDGYFVRQEKLFRELYDKVRLINPSDIDFSMDVSSVTNQVATWCEVIRSRTLSIFYGAILATIVAVTCMLLFSEPGGF